VRVVQAENTIGDFWFTVRAGNGRTVAQSEMYTSRRDAIRAARALIRLFAPSQPVRLTFFDETGGGELRVVSEDIQ